MHDKLNGGDTEGTFVRVENKIVSTLTIKNLTNACNKLIVGGVV